MYKRILLPVDGSRLSRNAVAGAMHFAKNIGAQVVGLHVRTLLQKYDHDDWVPHDRQFDNQRMAYFKKLGDEYLNYVMTSALETEVPCTCKSVADSEPYQAILRAAEVNECDLIFLTAHEDGDNPSRLLADEATKILAFSRVPVLLHKPV